MAMIRLESPFALQAWFRGPADVQNTLFYYCSCSVQFETSIASFPSIFEPREVVVLDTGQSRLGSGRGEHLDLARQTRKIRGSVTDPKQRSGSSGVLEGPDSSLFRSEVLSKI